MGKNDPEDKDPEGAMIAVKSILEEDPDEEEMEIEDLNKETIDSKKIVRCRKCRRMKFGHPLPWGEKNCELNRIDDDEELRKDNLTKNMQRQVMRRNKKKPDNTKKEIEDRKRKEDKKDSKLESLVKERERIREMLERSEKERNEAMEDEKEKIAKDIEQMKYKLEQNQKEAAAKAGGARKKTDEREGYRKGNERDKYEYRDRRYGEHQRNSDDEMRRERRSGRYNGDEWRERKETRHDRREYDRHEFRFGDGDYHNYGSYREGSRRSQSREYSCGNRRRETSSDSRRGYRESSRDTEYFADTLNRKIDPPPTWDENISLYVWARAG